MNRKRLVLMILLVLLALSVVYAYLTMPRQERVSDGNAALVEDKRTQAERGASDVAGRGLLNLELLGQEPVPFPGAERDIFNYWKKPVVAKPQPVSKPAAPKSAPPPPPPPPPPVVRKPLSQFTFLGFLSQGNEQKVFLSSGGTVYVVGQGETFGRQDEFEVVEIARNIMTVKRSGQNNTQRVLLVEKGRLDENVSAPATVAPRPQPAPEPEPVPTPEPDVPADNQ